MATQTLSASTARDNLVEWLRSEVEGAVMSPERREYLRQAADEIERLREMVNSTAWHTSLIGRKTAEVERLREEVKRLNNIIRGAAAELACATPAVLNGEEA